MVTFFFRNRIAGRGHLARRRALSSCRTLATASQPLPTVGAEDAVIARLPRDPSSSSLGGVPRHAVLLASTNSPAGVSILASGFIGLRTKPKGRRCVPL